jgi:hypothetical protein
MPDKPGHQDLLKRIKASAQEEEGRKKAEEELREGREHLRSLMESATNEKTGRTGFGLDH